MNCIFKIKREERWPALVALLGIVALNALMVLHRFDQFTKAGKIGYWSLFSKHFELSGFDIYTYLTLSKWEVYYTEYRHPLLSFFWYPFYKLNDWLMWHTGTNFAIILVALVMVILSVYSVIFMRRVFREVMELDKLDANILTGLFFSFAYIMLAVFVPDHFGISLCLLALTLYIAGKHLKQGTSMPIWQTATLFIFTAGVTLSNGVKTFLSALFCNGKRLFHWKYLLLGIALPTLLLGAEAIWQNKTFIIPHRQQGQRILEMRMAKDSVFRAQTEASQRHAKEIHGKALQKRGVLSWVDLSVSRSHSLVENVFGESIILHRDYLLQDIGRKRPVFVAYHTPVLYMVEALLVMLFLAGLWCGRKKKFLWMVGSWVAFDAFIHLVLGFGLNEAYIMTAHWAFIIPIAIGYLIKTLGEKGVARVRMAVTMLGVFLFCYNGMLIYQYL